MWVVGEVTENRQRAEQEALFPLGPSPTDNTTVQPCGLPCPGEHLGLSAPYYKTVALRQKNMAQMKEQFKAPEKV